jgi:hypothetical protein
MDLAIVGTIITCVTIICGTMVSIMKPRVHTQLPGCKNSFELLNTKLTNEVHLLTLKLDSAVNDAWREVNISKTDRDSIRRTIVDDSRTVIQLETEMKNVHSEIREIKNAITVLGDKIDILILGNSDRVVMLKESARLNKNK